MTRLHRARVGLCIIGEDLDPDEVTDLLGAAPTISVRKGERRPVGRGREIAARQGSWRLHADDASPGDLDGRIGTILARLTADLSVWRDLSRRYQCDVFCGLFLRDGNEGAALEPHTRAELGARGLILDLGIYGPPD